MPTEDDTGDRLTVTLHGEQDRGLVLLENSSPRRPARIRERFDSREVLGPINDTVADAWIEVNGVQYWIEGIWA